MIKHVFQKLISEITDHKNNISFLDQIESDTFSFRRLEIDNDSLFASVSFCLPSYHYHWRMSIKKRIIQLHKYLHL